MHLFFLEAAVPLTKSYAQDKGGNVVKTPYPFVWEMTSHEVEITSLAQFKTALDKHAALGHCLLKGSLRRPLVQESRAGSTDTSGSTEWVVFDLDGLPESYMHNDKKVAVTVDSMLAAVGITDVSYIVQWSASYGIENKKLRAHVFMLLDKPYMAPLLKQWLIQLNHTTPMLRAAMGLTKTGNAISWPLDISACQNDKLIYIAPPVLKGIKDPLPKNRITLIKRGKEHLSLGSSQIHPTAKNRALTDKRLDELREEAGMPKRKTTYKMHGTVEVLVKPDSATITEMKQERGFVYFNLNGGDSWAYYHPENNPDYIYNFKGEPTYLTKELLPDYWEELTSKGSRVNSTGTALLAFCDRATSTYWRGTYDANNDQLELHMAKNETQVRHFGKQFGLPLGDYIPEWDLIFNPQDNVRVDFDNRIVNTFQPSKYMKATAKPVKTIPKTIAKIIAHALGDSDEIFEHFINWLAFILQRRDRTKTAWVLHGTQGTGKGIMMNRILRPLFGDQHVATRRMEELDEKYNHFMKNSMLVFVDEVQTKALQNEGAVMAKLKNFITEPFVPIRLMHANSVECANYCNWIFASNRADPISIDSEDRRFNVGRYQPTKLQITDQELDALDNELQAFHDYLLYYKLDAAKAQTVMASSDRSTMISISRSSLDTVADAILDGSFKFFVEQMPTDGSYASDTKNYNRVENYRTVLQNLLGRTNRTSGQCNVGRDELRILFDYSCGSMPDTPNKFTSLLKHHRIHTEPVWVNAKTVNGFKIMWKDTKEWPSYLEALASSGGPPALKPKKSPSTPATATKPSKLNKPKLKVIK
jgi:hypothetical protein